MRAQPPHSVGVQRKYNSITKHHHAPQLGGGVGEQALGHVGVDLGQQLVLGVGGQGQALQDREAAQDEGVVGRHPEGVPE